MNGKGFEPSKMPKAVFCYICGRGYGTSSIAIHLKTCAKKWDVDQEKLPKGQRRQVPTKPKTWDDIVAKGGKVTQKELDKLNEDAY